MRVYDCDEGKEKDLSGDEFVDVVAGLLARGRVVAMPTDTVFGLVAAAQHEVGVARVAALKGRDRGLPPPVVLGSAASAYSLSSRVTWPLLDLVAPFWPAPLSAVISCRAPLARIVNPGGSTVAVRVPGSDILRRVAERISVVASSANRHGYRPVNCGKDIFAHFEGAPWPVRDVLLSHGVALVVAEVAAGGSSSTVLSWEEGRLVCLRKGAGDDLLRTVDSSFAIGRGA